MAERELADRVKTAARAAGFDAVGICDLRPVERQTLRDWLEAGYAASMRYMHRQATRRQRPADIVPGCRRAVVVLKNHHVQARNPEEGVGRVARYAWGEDYHRVLGDQLTRLTAALIELGSAPELTRWYVDAGPLPERELAQRAGLGWIAKNTMLIHPRLGSFTFIGTVLTDLELSVDAPFAADRCGTCRRCLETCPTEAFAAPRLLDARRCISYLTIEHRGSFDPEQGGMIGIWLFGCDLCQEVCPWNRKFAPTSNEPRFAARPAVTRADLDDLAHMDACSFADLFGDTAFERAGPAGIARNARQVLRNLARAPQQRGDG